MMQSYTESRATILAHYGRVCSCCGSSENLGIDHVNGDGRQHRDEIGRSSDQLYRWLIRNGFPDGFQTLCGPCNASKANGERCMMHDPDAQYAIKELVTVKVEAPARQALARFAYALTGAASQRISQTRALTVACTIALKHLDESVSAIGESEEQ